MDFNLIMRWGLAYSILMVSIVLIVGPIILLTERFSSRYLHWSPGIVTLIIIGALVMISDPLRKRITRFVDLIIFKSPDFQAILKGIEDILHKPDNLINLSRPLVEKLKEIYGADHAGVLIWNFKTSIYQLLPPEAFINQIINRIHEEINRTDFLVRTLETERRLFWQGVVIEDEITALGTRAFPGERTTFWKIRRTMRWLGAAACVPLMSQDQLVGFIVLGHKKNEVPYNNEDKKFLSHVAEIVTTAIKDLVYETSTSFTAQPGTAAWDH